MKVGKAVETFKHVWEHGPAVTKRVLAAGALVCITAFGAAVGTEIRAASEYVSGHSDKGNEYSIYAGTEATLGFLSLAGTAFVIGVEQEIEKRQGGPRTPPTDPSLE